MPTPSRRSRWLRGGLVSLIGLLAIALSAADLAPWIPDPWWGPETLAGEAVLVALAGGLVACGCWLATRDWARRHLTAVVVRTYAVTAGATVLFAWAVVIQLWSVGGPEPYVIALDGVLIAALTAFGTAVLHVGNLRVTEADRRTEAEYRALAEEVIDCSTVATVVVDAEGDIAWLNSAAAATFGVDREDAVGGDREAVIGATLERVEADSPATGASSHVEYRVQPRDGREPRWVECSRHEIEDGLHAGGWIEQYTDVTERREAVDTLAAVARLPGELPGVDSTSAESVPDLLDLGREQLGVEYAAYTLVDGGRSVETVSSERFDPTGGDPVPDLHTRSLRAVERTGGVQTGSRGFEKGGFEFDHGAVDDAFESFIAAPVAVDGEQIGVVTFLSRRDGAVAEWERALVELVAEWLGYERERERLLDDRRAYAEALEHERERLEFINRIVRHNILNGLNLLNARTEHLAAGVDDPEAAEHLSVIRSRVDDMADLIDTIRTFMDAALREGRAALEPVPIRAALEEKLSLAAETYDANFRVHDLPDPDLRVQADELSGEVFENVLSNAVEHTDRAEPTVDIWTTRSTELLPLADEGAPATPESATDAPTVLSDGGEPQTERTEQPALTVHVADDGPGISDEQKRRLLHRGDADLSDPGTGFGFYLVREMMESYGGGVRIRDNEPRGTVIELVFPVEG